MPDKFVVVRAAADLPQSTTETLYTVSGGKVLIHGMVGEVTTAIQSQPDSATVYFGADALISLAGVDLSGAAAGKLIGMPDPVLSTAAGYVNPNAVYPFPHVPLVMQDGAAIRLNCSASNTGQVQWTLWYEALDQGAKVVAN